MKKIITYFLCCFVLVCISSCTKNNTDSSEKQKQVVEDISNSTVEDIEESVDVNIWENYKNYYKEIKASYFWDSNFNYCLKYNFDVCVFEGVSINWKRPQCEDYILWENVNVCQETGTGSFEIFHNSIDGKSSAFALDSVLKPSHDEYMQYNEFISCIPKRINECVSESDFRKGSITPCENFVWKEGREQCIENKKQEGISDEDLCKTEQCRFNVVMRKAYESLDEGMCDALEWYYADECFNNILFSKALKEKDKDICQRMKNTSENLSYSSVFCLSEIEFLLFEERQQAALNRIVNN